MTSLLRRTGTSSFSCGHLRVSTTSLKKRREEGRTGKGLMLLKCSSQEDDGLGRPRMSPLTCTRMARESVTATKRVVSTLVEQKKVEEGRTAAAESLKLLDDDVGLLLEALDKGREELGPVDEVERDVRAVQEEVERGQ